METIRFERGMELLKTIDGDGGEAVIRSLEPHVEFAFGDIYAREGLTLRDRELITLASLLTAGGCEPQLEVHIRAALHVGVPPETVLETFLQCAPYTGFPRVLNAVFAAGRVLAEAQSS